MPQQQFPYEPNYYAGQPVDPNTVYNRQAQLYYQQQRQQGQYSQQDPLRNSVTRNSTFYQSAYDAADPMPNIQPQEQRYYGAQQKAAYRDIGNRVVQGAGNFFGPLGSFGLTESAAQVGGAMGGFPGSMIGYGVGAAAQSFGGEYLGMSEMSRQFSRIDDLQSVSDKFMAGSSSGDPLSGRMQRDGAKRVNRTIEEYARYASAYGQQDISSDELRKQVAEFTENDILENVKSAEDFARKFTALKDGVKRITEVLGKSFEEGSKLLGQYRNLGMDPQNATSMIDNINRMGTLSGSGFDTTNAAGMQSAMQLQGSGLTPQAAVMTGAQAETSGEQIYQNRALGERALYNLGGKQGMKQRLQQIMPQLMKSPFTQQAMMAAYNGEKISQKRLQQFAEGEISPTDAYENMDSYEDMLQFRATSGKAFSKMVEDDPVRASGMILKSATARLKDTGMEFGSDAQLNQQLADMLGMRKPDVKLLRAQIRTRNEGISRERQRRIQQGRGRIADDMGTLDLRFISESEVYNDAVDFGARSADFLSDNAYDAAEGITNTTRFLMSGRRELPGTSKAFAQYAKNEADEAGPVGGFYREASLSFTDSTDVYEEMKDRGDIAEEDITKVRLSNNFGTQGISRQELKNMGINNKKKLDNLEGTTDLSRVAREGGIKIFESESTVGGANQYEILNAEDYQESLTKQKKDARVGRSIRNNLDTQYSDLSERQRNVLGDLEDTMIKKMEGDFGDKIRDSYNGGIKLQGEMRKQLLSAARDEYGNIGEEKLMRKVQGVGGTFLGTYQSEYSDVINQMGEYDQLGGGSNALIQDAKNLGQRFTETITEGPELTSEYFQDRLGVDQETAKTLENRVRTKYQEIRDEEGGMFQTPEDAMARAVESAQGMDGKAGEAAKRLKEIVGNKSKLKKARRQIGDDEDKMQKFAQYSILKRAKEKGQLDEYESRFDRSYKELQNDVHKIVGSEEVMEMGAESLSDIVGEESVSEYIRTIGEETEGTQSEVSQQGTRREATQQTIEEQAEYFKSLANEMDALVKQNNEKLETMNNHLQSISTNTEDGNL